MNAYPFSVFKRADRKHYCVSFKDIEGKYLRPISTGKKTEEDAIQTAFQWLRDGIPQKEKVVNVKNLVMKDVIQQIDNMDDVKLVLNELKRRNMLVSYVLPDTKKSTDFIQFLLGFWDWETSAYVKEKLRKKHSIHQYHCKRMKSSVEHYWQPVFNGKLLGEITRQDIDNFTDILNENNMAAGTKNNIIKAGTIGLRWAYSKDMLENDVTKGITLYAGKSKERQILSPELAQAVFKVQWKDQRSMLGNLLWNDLDKLKTTKNNEARIVEVPFPGLILDLLRLASQNPWGQGLDRFVFWSEIHDDAPMNLTRFLDDFRDAMQKTGLSKEASMVYTFHSWRHYFTTYMRDKLTERLLQSQTGHKSLAMLNHYSEHRRESDRKRIKAAQVEVFSSLLPIKM